MPDVRGVLKPSVWVFYAVFVLEIEQRFGFPILEGDLSACLVGLRRSLVQFLRGGTPPEAPFGCGGGAAARKASGRRVRRCVG
jgi:hypothetical protein